LALSLTLPVASLFIGSYTKLTCNIKKFRGHHGREVKIAAANTRVSSCFPLTPLLLAPPCTVRHFSEQTVIQLKQGFEKKISGI
jgi:hypothetical protein